MDYDSQLKLQAYLDGELSEAEGREVANWLAKDQGAVALMGELRNTRKALTAFEAGTRLPESREFYWSKIEREIRRLEPEPARERPSLVAAWRRFLVPAGAVAALVIAALVANIQVSQSSALEASSADPGAFTYRDYASGTTLVWLSYPAENDVARNASAVIVP
jgi:anti-sigma factor RsiW